MGHSSFIEGFCWLHKTIVNQTDVLGVHDYVTFGDTAKLFVGNQGKHCTRPATVETSHAMVHMRVLTKPL